VRLSCGIEAPEDLVEDLARAFARVTESAGALQA
jgi:cystathionine beta-lyase/cystathionine gamma-synthase